MTRMILTGGRIVDPRNGVDAILDMEIEDGRIAAVGRHVTSARAATVIDFSLWKKSPDDIVATCVRESFAQGRMRGGCARAKSFTDFGALRSEFPCLSTGFTALPFTLS